MKLLSYTTLKQAYDDTLYGSGSKSTTQIPTNTNQNSTTMKTMLKIIPAAALLFLAATSCRKVEPYAVQTNKITSVPNTGKPALPPSISSADMQFLNTFKSANAAGSMKTRSTDEVFASASERSYAYNEFDFNRIVYYLYGGKNDNETAGRWFSRIILQWDAGSHTWKVFFNDGVQYYSLLTDEIALTPDAWYYTLQWVWDPAARKWLKFNVNLLVHT